MGLLGGWLFSIAMRRRLTSKATEQIGTFALTLATYSFSTAVGGYGFIEAFVGGLFFGFITKNRNHQAVALTDGMGTLLSVLAWTIFGALLVISLFTTFNPLALL